MGGEERGAEKCIIPFFMYPSSLVVFILEGVQFDNVPKKCSTPSSSSGLPNQPPLLHHQCALWLTLGKVYGQMERYVDSVEALHKVLCPLCLSAHHLKRGNVEGFSTSAVLVCMKMVFGVFGTHVVFIFLCIYVCVTFV